MIYHHVWYLESTHLHYLNVYHVLQLCRLTFQAAKCLSTIISSCGEEVCKTLQNGSNDKVKGYHLYAPAQFSISELAPVGGLIGLESCTSRGWRDAEHDGRGVRKKGGKKCLICKSSDHFNKAGVEKRNTQKEQTVCSKSAHCNREDSKMDNISKSGLGFLLFNGFVGRQRWTWKNIISKSH